MRKLAVNTIVIPMKEGVSLTPSVAPGDRITEALEVMLENDLKCIAVVHGNQVVGMITLEDALKKVGLEKGKTPKRPQSLVVHGRKIVVEK
jgi:predicted transcriptional regulator